MRRTVRRAIRKARRHLLGAVTVSRRTLKRKWRRMMREMGWGGAAMRMRKIRMTGDKTGACIFFCKIGWTFWEWSPRGAVHAEPKHAGG